MSERKSDEIKFRVEPSVKARWQAAADASPQYDGLSDFLRQAAEREANPIHLLDVDESQFQTLLSVGGPHSVIHNITDVVHHPQPEYPKDAGEEVAAASAESKWKPFGA
jgi:hypothetical protein